LDLSLRTSSERVLPRLFFEPNNKLGKVKRLESELGIEFRARRDLRNLQVPRPDYLFKNLDYHQLVGCHAPSALRVCCRRNASSLNNPRLASNVSGSRPQVPAVSSQNSTSELKSIMLGLRGKVLLNYWLQQGPNST